MLCGNQVSALSKHCNHWKYALQYCYSEVCTFAFNKNPVSDYGSTTAVLSHTTVNRPCLHLL